MYKVVGRNILFFVVNTVGTYKNLGEQFKMFEVLEFITEHKILISKIERVEPSLESLFMEVVSK